MHTAGLWVAAGFGLYFVLAGFLAIVRWMGMNLDSEDRGQNIVWTGDWTWKIRINPLVTF